MCSENFIMLLNWQNKLSWKNECFNCGKLSNKIKPAGMEIGAVRLLNFNEYLYKH